MNIYANMSAAQSVFLVFGMMLPFLALAAAVVCLITQAYKALVRYTRSGEMRRRVERKARAKAMGARLKACRVRRGMTPAYVAGAVGVSPGAVRRWERGAVELGAANLLPLADLYGVTVEELQSL